LQNKEIHDTINPELIRDFYFNNMSESVRHTPERKSTLYPEIDENILKKFSPDDAKQIKERYHQFMERMAARTMVNYAQIYNNADAKNKKYELHLDEAASSTFLQTMEQHREEATEVAILTYQLENSANIDELTGLNRRDVFLLRCEKERERAATQENEKSYIVFIDLDRYKSVNDVHGHEAGDKLLERVGDKLRSILRGVGDVPARLGGDEIAILLRVKPETNIQQAVMRIYRELASIDRVEGKPEEGKLSLSMGVRAIEANYPTTSTIRDSDSAAYTSKREGRGGITFISDSEDAKGIFFKAQNQDGEIIFPEGRGVEIKDENREEITQEMRKKRIEEALSRELGCVFEIHNELPSGIDSTIDTLARQIHDVCSVPRP